jgi:hypothetical protein
MLAFILSLSFVVRHSSFVIRLTSLRQCTTVRRMECPFNSDKKPAYYGSYLAVDKLPDLQARSA